MEAFEKIIFQEKEYFLIGSKEEGGAIATKEQFEKNEMSFAALFPNGTVMKEKKQIGVVGDITFTAEFEVLEEPLSNPFGNMDYETFVNYYSFSRRMTIEDLIGMEFGITIIDPFHTEDSEQAMKRAKDYIAGYLPGKKKEENE